jgi:hypothetical protein
MLPRAVMTLLTWLRYLHTLDLYRRSLGPLLMLLLLLLLL